MSIVATTTRTALTVAQLPLRATLGVLGRSEGAAQIAVDRVGAAVRDTVGRLTGDAELRAEARREEAAADEREKALRLRKAAAQREQQGRQHRDDVQDTAQEQREQAEKFAEKRKAKVRDEAQAERTKQRDAEKRDQLRQLKAKEAALEERGDALESADEAVRLKKAAARAKAERKSRA